MPQNNNLSINNNQRVNKTNFTLSNSNRSSNRYDQYAYNLAEKLKEVELLIGLGPILEDKDRKHLRNIVKKMYTSLSN